VLNSPGSPVLLAFAKIFMYNIKSKKALSPNEESIISLSEKLFSPTLDYAKIVKGIGDDAAVIADKDNSKTSRTFRLVTIDAIVEGTHFSASDDPEQIGWKAVAVNVSDVAAMGGNPDHLVVSAILPPGTKPEYVKAIMKGLKKAADTYKVAIVGGDTVGGKTLSLTISMFGAVEKENVCYRSGAKPGDFIAVTGKLGGSLKSGRHLDFKPRINEARWLIENAKPSAMMDLSDGLAKDGNRLAKASNVSIKLHSEKIPVNFDSYLEGAMTDGEDFELFFSVPELSEEKIKIFENKFKIPLTIIGEVSDAPPALFLDGKILEPKGFEHFLQQDDL